MIRRSLVSFFMMSNVSFLTKVSVHVSHHKHEAFGSLAYTYHMWHAICTIYLLHMCLQWHATVRGLIHKGERTYMNFPSSYCNVGNVTLPLAHFPSISFRFSSVSHCHSNMSCSFAALSQIARLLQNGHLTYCIVGLRRCAQWDLALSMRPSPRLHVQNWLETKRKTTRAVCFLQRNCSECAKSCADETIRHHGRPALALRLTRVGIVGYSRSCDSSRDAWQSGAEAQHML